MNETRVIFKGYLIIVGGDMPGIEAVQNMMGHGSYHGCRWCKNAGILMPGGTKVYFPLVKPKDMIPSNVDTSNWNDVTPRECCEGLRRDKTSILQACEQITEARKESKAAAERVQRSTGLYIFVKNSVNMQDIIGIKGFSELYRLPTIDPANSFALDVMHMAFLNIFPNIFDHWRGTFFTGRSNDQNSLIISENNHRAIGVEMGAHRNCIPTDMGRTVRDHYKKKTGFKSEENARFYMLFNFLFEDYVPEALLAPFCTFAATIQKSVESTSLTQLEIEEIEKDCWDFYDHYER